jgi:phenylalanyl-tRNA synthetase beta chain
LVDAGRAAVLDIDLTALQSQPKPPVGYKPVNRFPTSAFDLSVIVNARELAGNLELKIRECSGDLAESVEYVREFHGAPLVEGQKSVTFRVVAAAPDRTLSSTEITGLRDRIIASLVASGYETRR